MSPQGDESASALGSLPVPSAGGDDEIPEFLREAGWGENTGTFQEGSGTLGSADESEEPALAEGDLPDWVKAMAPTGASMEDSTPQAGADEDLTQDDIPDWLLGLDDVQSTPSDEQPAAEQAPLEGDLPDWLESMKPAENALPESQPQEQMMADSTSDDDLPDWLKSIQSEDEQAAPGDVPQEMPSEPTEELMPESQPQEQMMADSTNDDDLPDWLKSIQSEDEQVAPGEVPQEMPSEPAEELMPESQPQEQMMANSTNDDDLPDWLKSIQSEDEQAEPGEIPQEMPSETPLEPVQETSEMSEESLSDWQIGDEATAESVAFDATDTGTLGTSADEQDDAIAWLEGLAAKHGAKPEELVMDPEARTEIEPEWVQRAKATQEQAGAEMPVSEEQSIC